MTLRMQGRLAGISYLGVVIFGIIALAYGPGQLIVPKDASATLENLTARPGLFYGMIICGILMNAFFAALLYWLLRILKSYGRRAALLMVFLAMASVPFTVLAFGHYGALALSLADGTATVEGVAQTRSSYRYWLLCAIFFWGAWLAPYGWLAFKSRIFPRFLAVMLMIGSVCYLIDLFGSILIDGFYGIPFANYITLPASIGEIGSCLWLTIFGASAARSEQPGITATA